MRHLLGSDGELKPGLRQLVLLATLVYGLAVAAMCFGPQWGLGQVETPGIIHVGRLVFLLVPFNSLVNLGQIQTFHQLAWVVGQNLSNIFLLYPLVLGLIFLSPRWRSPKAVLKLGFSLSLTIELGQLLLDLLIDANRVFELDDLWTNSLGAYLALVTYEFLMRRARRNLG